MRKTTPHGPTGAPGRPAAEPTDEAPLDPRQLSVEGDPAFGGIHAGTLETLPDATLVVDARGLIVIANHAFEELSGFPLAEAVGAPLAMLENPGHPAKDRPSGTHAVNRYRRKDGSPFWGEASVRNLTNATGEAVGTVITIHNVTERHEAEERCSRDRDNLVQAQAAARIGSWELDLTSNDLHWSDEIYRIFEIDPERFGASYEAFLDAIHPDDREFVNQAYTDSVSGRTPYDIVHRLLFENDRVKYVRETCTTEYDELGAPTRSLGTVQDITDRFVAAEQARKASRYARTLLEASLDPLVTISPDGKITDVNQATENGTGVGRSHLVGTDFADYFTEPEAAREGYRRVLSEGHVRDYPLTLRHISGRTTDVLYNAVTYEDESGEIQGVFAAARDITEQRAALRALTRSEERYRELNKELEGRVAARTNELQTAVEDLESFSYSVSHDLRAPLRAIDGFSAMLVKNHSGQLDSEALRLLDMVRENADRMAELIDDILAFSRLGRKEISLNVVDMVELAQSVWDSLEPECEDREIRLVIGDLPAARGDIAMVRQVLANLLTNAIKFTGPRGDGAQIEIDGHPEGDMAVYSVRDNGVGFDTRYAHKLFGVFQRLHSDEEFPGTGIGLALSKRIVSKHGCWIRAEGAVDEGATITFALPLAECDGVGGGR